MTVKILTNIPVSSSLSWPLRGACDGSFKDPQILAESSYNKVRTDMEVEWEKDIFPLFAVSKTIFLDSKLITKQPLMEKTFCKYLIH